MNSSKPSGKPHIYVGAQLERQANFEVPDSMYHTKTTIHNTGFPKIYEQSSNKNLLVDKTQFLNDYL